MAVEFARSVGQGHRFTHVPARNESIVSRLHSRTLSGRSLGIGVHQHLGYRLHLVWDGRGRLNERCRERCIERRFATREEAQLFYEDLTCSGCEGLSDCIVWYFDEHKIDKADFCNRASAQSQKRLDIKDSWVKHLQEKFPHNYWCNCLVRSEGAAIVEIFTTFHSKISTVL
jgi:hypothetical protein